MLNIFKSLKGKALTVISPQTGKSIPINQIPDEVFSEKILGDGVAIIPKENKVVSPIDGEIVQVAEAGHAFCIRSEEGLELMLHIGVNTAGLKGKGFKCFVKNGDIVKKGDTIGTADIKFIEESGYPLHTAVLITNLEKFQNLKPIYDKVEAGKTPIITYEIKKSYINNQKLLNESGASHMTTKNSLFSTLQRIGQAFMLPIALLPVAGILLGIGASFSNPQMIDSFHLQNILGSSTFLNFIFTIMKRTGGVVFANLPIIFAIGIAIGMAKKEKAAAALSAVISFLVMHETISSLLELNGKLAKGVLHDGSTALACGIQSLEMGVFGGIIVGLGVAYLHNRFYKIKLPDVISFFSGIRFVPIISCFCYIFVGSLMYFIWPHIQSAMYNLGGLVTASKYTGTLIYGIIERALIPFGLHHVFYIPFWQTALGGAEIINNHYVTGAQNIFFAELASSSITKFSIGAARFMAGKFPFMIFGLPAAAFAMYKSAKPSKKKVVGGLLLSAAITSILTGITEPIEFTFLFVAPILYGLHCLLAGLSFMLMHLLKVTVGMTFSGGIIDLILFGVLQGNSKTNWVYIIPVGLGYTVVYYFFFKFVIYKFNLITPGREDDELESKLYTKKDFNPTINNTSEIILNGLGGIENIVNLDCCATRLRVKVKEEEKVDETVIKESGCAGIIKKGNGIQIVFGPRVTVIKSELEEYISSLANKVTEEA